MSIVHTAYLINTRHVYVPVHLSLSPEAPPCTRAVCLGSDMLENTSANNNSRTSSSSFTSSVTSASSTGAQDLDNLCPNSKQSIVQDTVPPPPLQSRCTTSEQPSPSLMPPTSSVSPVIVSPSSSPEKHHITAPAIRDPPTHSSSQHQDPKPTPPPPDVLRPLSSTEFNHFLLAFEQLNLAALDPASLHAKVKQLLDRLDFLTDKLPLALNERLFTALSSPTALTVLIAYLQDTNVATHSRPGFDVLKSFRYPYIVASILGSPKIADAMLAHATLIDALLDVLCVSDRLNPVVVVYTINVLVTYLEYSPLPVLDRIGPEFVKALAFHLYHPSVLELLPVLFPSRSVETAYTMDPAAVSFDDALAKALAILTSAKCYHLFAESFAESSEKAADAYTVSDMVASACSGPSSGTLEDEDPVEEERVHSLIYDIDQKALNAIEAYLIIVERTVRIVRIDSKSPYGVYLNPFATETTSCTLATLLHSGIRAYTKSEGRCAQFLIAAVDAVARSLLFVEADAEKRVATTSGQPPPICCDALTAEISPLLAELMYLATEKSEDARRAARVRMHILELMSVCQRVLDPKVFSTLDRLRFGEVALKMLMLHPANSMLHSSVTKAVEAALLSERSSSRSVTHWLTNSRLPEKLIKAWRREKGSDLYSQTHCRANLRVPLVSALAQMACVVHHWMACERAQGRDPARVVGPPVADAFGAFFDEHLAPHIESERSTLGGNRPSRPRVPLVFGAVRRSSISQRRALLASTVRSPSAHRFGYEEPPPAPPKSSLVDIFDVLDEDNSLDFGLSVTTVDDLIGHDALSGGLKRSSHF